MLQLPEALPVFPLNGVLLLPGGRLPLHIFELRYRNLIADAMDGEPIIGIIQPRDEEAEVLDEKLPAPDHAEPQLYEVGCAGLVERCEKLNDGRYLVLLRGVRRFRVVRELELHRGYRRVEPDYSEFETDEHGRDDALSVDRLIRALRSFGEEHNLQFELDKLRELPGVALINSIAMVLPFEAAEKQALLEAPDVEVRYETLLTLMDMGFGFTEDSGPTLN